MQSAIAPFCARYFSLRGAWHLNRHALGMDMLRAPINVFYAPIWVSLQLISILLSRVGLKGTANTLRDLPSGLITSVQRRIRHAIIDEIIAPHLAPMGPEQRHLVDLNLMRYQAARNAVADIGANLAVLLAGMLLFQQFTPGGLSLGQLTGDAMSQHWAIDHFWAGETLGRIWYGWFPAQTPVWATLTAIAFTMVMIALVAAFSGLLMDPLQNALGCHHRRLNRLLQGLHLDMAAQKSHHYQPREPFWARAFDVLDWLRF